MKNITLVCWSCGKKMDIDTARPPQFAFELSLMAQEAGWIGAIDMNRARSLVFCCKEHSDREKTKSGTYRLRSKYR